MIKLKFKGFRKFRKELRQVTKMTQRISRDYEIIPMPNGEIRIKKKSKLKASMVKLFKYIKHLAFGHWEHSAEINQEIRNAWGLTSLDSIYQLWNNKFDDRWDNEGTAKYSGKELIDEDEKNE